MTQSPNNTVEWLANRAQIEDVLHRYCRAIDRIQLDLLATVFHPDAIIDNGPYNGNVEGFIDNVGKRHPTVPYASHMVMNMLVNFLGPDESPTKAFVESWCLALEQHPAAGGGPFQIDRIHRVRYGDIFEKRAGEWRIAKRVTIIDHIMSVPVDPALAPAMGDRIWGRRDNKDPVVKMRAELGLSTVD